MFLTPLLQILGLIFSQPISSKVRALCFYQVSCISFFCRNLELKIVKRTAVDA